jgi:hypothetical protein
VSTIPRISKAVSRLSASEEDNSMFLVARFDGVDGYVRDICRQNPEARANFPHRAKAKLLFIKMATSDNELNSSPLALVDTIEF